MNKKQQTLNPEAAVEMVIKMQDRQTNAIEILSGLILQFEQINYVLHKLMRQPVKQVKALMMPGTC
mgnify:CR=1 FL=1